ncbi:MAG: CinA family protein [Candidatus Limnocylindrales bacterium]
MAEEPPRILAERLQDLCLRRHLTVASAESCTGGLVASVITDVGGSSGYFRGGVVVYSNEAKASLLGVPEALLEAHGAVSAQVARSMAVAARARLAADLAVSVTGVAGPGGGTAAKPVGLSYVAVADAAGVEVRRFVWGGERLANKESSVRAALEMLIAHVEGLGAVGAKEGIDEGGSEPDTGESEA